MRPLRRLWLRGMLRRAREERAQPLAGGELITPEGDGYHASRPAAQNAFVERHEETLGAPMRHIMVLNSKGGCGKSTIATNLAAYYASEGYNVALADFDSQGSSLNWLKR